MTPLLPLLVNALALLPLAPLTVAKHVVCSWRPGIATPDKYGFNRVSALCSITSQEKGVKLTAHSHSAVLLCHPLHDHDSRQDHGRVQVQAPL